jgi:hypothetical protein
MAGVAEAGGGVPAASVVTELEFDDCPQAARAISALDTKIDFNANAHLTWLRFRIEFIMCLPELHAAWFTAVSTYDRNHVGAHNHLKCQNHQPVAICMLDMSNVPNVVAAGRRSDLRKQILRAIAAIELRVFPIAEEPSSTFAARVTNGDRRNKQMSEQPFAARQHNTDDTPMAREDDRNRNSWLREFHPRLLQP